ncbi:MAG: hypothetical protein H6832_14860 [Planctomycetes bacterium]|nr:hypothetical protein [Planctomycetota bacterium]
MIRRWLCGLLGHAWVRSPLSERYRRCKRCGEEEYWNKHIGWWTR